MKSLFVLTKSIAVSTEILILKFFSLCAEKDFIQYKWKETFKKKWNKWKKIWHTSFWVYNNKF